MLRRALVAALLAAGSACAAPVAGTGCDGTWDGTVGGTPMMLQFNWDGLGSWYAGTALTG